LFSAVNRGLSRCFTAAGCFDDAAIDRDIVQLEADDLVVGLQADLLKPGEDPGGYPLIAAPADRGR